LDDGSLAEFLIKSPPGSPLLSPAESENPNPLKRKTVQVAGRILVVDDEETVREIIISILASEGFECRGAASGVDALHLLESEKEFDLLLADLMMKHMDGIALLGRSRYQYPDMPVVFVTAVHDVQVALQSLRNGAYDYLLKPFEREQLLAAVRRALEDRRLKLEQRAYVSNLEARVAALTQQLH
jgi:DNA-binding NtrC family response regulator